VLYHYRAHLRAQRPKEPQSKRSHGSSPLRGRSFSVAHG
jgi:hypothetical protein